jgi:hypothetical protein
MANRFPLVLDTTDNNKIKEIQTGDNLYLADNSITGVQNITALGTIDAADIKVNGNRLVAQAFNDLIDTPSTFVGSPNYFVKVKSDGTGLEYRPLADLGNIEIDTITVDTSIVPSVNNVGNVGTEAKKFNEIVGTSIKGNLVSYNEEIVFDATTGKVSYAALQGAPTFLSEFTDDVGFLQTSDLNTTLAGLFDDGVPFTTDIVGSVFGDDSTMLVDSVASVITGDVLNTEVITTGLVTTNATIATTTATTVNGPATGNLAIDAGTSGIVNIGFGGATTAVNIKNAVIESFAQGSGLGIAQITAGTNLSIAAGNRVKIDGGVPFRFSSVTTANQLAIGAEEGDVIYNTTTSRLQMYQGSAWKDVNGNVEATAGTSNFNDVIISGDLTITGDATELQTTNTAITDNVIVLNKGEAGAGVTLGTSGIQIDRGGLADKTLLWDEAADKWTVGAETFVAATVEATTLTDGSINITAGNLTGAAQITATTFVGNVTGDVTGNAAGAHTGTFDGDMTGTMSGDDSTILVDGINNKIVGVVDTASLTVSSTNVAIGNSAGLTGQNGFAVAIGTSAGLTNQSLKAVAVGDSAGATTQGEYAVAVGNNAGNTTQGANAVAVGRSAGVQVQGASAVAIGYQAGTTNQSDVAVAIGSNAGLTSQGTESVAIGLLAGKLNQGSQTIAIGSEAGRDDQGANGIALGHESGRADQAEFGIAIGEKAGHSNQGIRGIGIGRSSGKTDQGTKAVAIGDAAGYATQGANAIAIGEKAGETNQAANSIVINATGAAVENTTASSLVITPIRSAAMTTILGYNAATGEVTHNAAIPGYISLVDLKTEVAASADFAAFKVRIAAL